MLETFPDPLDPSYTMMVMPWLRPCNDPEFRTIGEIMDFIDQTTEVNSTISYFALPPPHSEL